MLGAILSRAIAADSPFGVIIAAAATLVLLHRLLAYTTYFFPPLGRLVKGQPSILAEGDTIPSITTNCGAPAFRSRPCARPCATRPTWMT